jgi:hypothetical protein
MPVTLSDRMASPADAPQRLERTPADSDQRHRVVLDFVYFTDAFASRYRGALKAILEQWRLAAAYSLESGLPYTAYVASDLKCGQEPVQRHRAGNHAQPVPAQQGRDVERTPRPSFSDQRRAADRQPRCVQCAQCRAQPRLDDVLYSTAGASLFPNPQFGQTYTATEPRVLQLGLSVGF